MKNLLIVCALAAAGAAQAQFINLAALYDLNPGVHDVPWITHIDPGGPTLDFTTNAPAFKVGASTGFVSGVGRFGYTLDGSVGWDYIDLVLQGDVEGLGVINYIFTAMPPNGQNTNVNGVVRGGSWAGGHDGAFTHVDRLNLNGPGDWQIYLYMTIQVPDQPIPTSDVASVGLVEENIAVTPEPATLAIVAAGAAALLRKRRR